MVLLILHCFQYLAGHLCTCEESKGLKCSSRYSLFGVYGLILLFMMLFSCRSDDLFLFCFFYPASLSCVEAHKKFVIAMASLLLVLAVHPSASALWFHE